MPKFPELDSYMRVKKNSSFLNTKIKCLNASSIWNQIKMTLGKC